MEVSSTLFTSGQVTMSFSFTWLEAYLSYLL
jgi:hypothetical protein